MPRSRPIARRATRRRRARGRRWPARRRRAPAAAPRSPAARHGGRARTRARRRAAREAVAALRRLRRLALGGGDHDSRAAGWAAGLPIWVMRQAPCSSGSRVGTRGRVRGWPDAPGSGSPPPCPRPARTYRDHVRAATSARGHPGRLRPDRAGVDLRGEGEARDHRAQAPRRTGPMVVEQLPPARAHHDAQDERDEDRVIELTGDGDEVGHEVERRARGSRSGGRAAASPAAGRADRRRAARRARRSPG